MLGSCAWGRGGWQRASDTHCSGRMSRANRDNNWPTTAAMTSPRCGVRAAGGGPRTYRELARDVDTLAPLASRRYRRRFININGRRRMNGPPRVRVRGGVLGMGETIRSPRLSPRSGLLFIPLLRRGSRTSGGWRGGGGDRKGGWAKAPREATPGATGDARTPPPAPKNSGTNPPVTEPLTGDLRCDLIGAFCPTYLIGSKPMRKSPGVSDRDFYKREELCTYNHWIGCSYSVHFYFRTVQAL
jgi:hypothetical protein